MYCILKYFVLFTCVQFLSAVKFRCDYQPTASGWFKYHKIPLTWYDARLMCQMEGAILASPVTVEIEKIMLSLIDKIPIFTGIHSTFSRGHYYTIDGIPLSEIDGMREDRWRLEEPDNLDNLENCISLDNSNKLADVRCDKVRPFVCFRTFTNSDVNICGTPDPEYHLFSQTNKCYKFHTVPRSFERAHFVCSAEGGHLAIINSDEESKVLSGIFSQSLKGQMLGNFRKDVAFIGFHNWGEGGDWRTIHGQSIQEAGFAKFHPGTPNNRSAGEYCGSILPTGLLNDLWCEENYAFICEKNPNYPRVCEPPRMFTPDSDLTDAKVN